MRQNHGKCDLDFRKPGSSESHNGNCQYLDCNFNNGMVIGGGGEILVKLLAGRLLGRESIGKLRFRCDPVTEGPFFQPENAKHIQQ